MGKKVLLVEDTVEYREKLVEDLEKGGYTVVSASNGLEGIEALKEEGGNVDLIVSDLHMPVLNGLEMAQKIFDENMTEAPIMILTTDASKEMKRKGKLVGIKTWILKPIKKETFLGTVNLLVEKFGGNS